MAIHLEPITDLSNPTLQALQRQLEDLTREKGEATRGLALALEQLDLLSSQNQAVKTELEQAFRQIDQLSLERTRLIQDKASLESSLLEYDERVTELESKLDHSEKVAIQFEKIHKKSAAEVLRLEQVKESLLDDLESSRTELEQARSKRSDLAEEIEQLKPQIESLHSEGTALRIQLEQKEWLYRESKKEVEALLTEGEELEAKLQELSPKLEQALSEKESLKLKTVQLNQQVRDVKDELRQASIDKEHALEENQKLKSETQLLEKEKAALEFELEEASAKSEIAVKKALEELKRTFEGSTSPELESLRQQLESKAQENHLLKGRLNQIEERAPKPTKKQASIDLTSLKGIAEGAASLVAKTTSTAGLYLFSSTATTLLSHYTGLSPVVSFATSTAALMADKKNLDSITNLALYAGIIGSFVGASDLDNYLEQDDLDLRLKTLTVGVLITLCSHLALLSKKS